MRNWNVNCLLQNNKSLGINMNIVSNVGQMFMFCVGSLLHHFLEMCLACSNVVYFHGRQLDKKFCYG